MKIYFLCLILLMSIFAKAQEKGEVTLADLQKVLYVDQDKSKALELIMNIDPADRSDLHVLATDFAWMYQNQKNYGQALKWAEFSDKIPVTSQMFWMFELGQRYPIVLKYREHMSKNPEDCEARAYMTEVFIAWNDLSDAWSELSSLGDDCDKKGALKKRLNDNLQYQPMTLKAKVLNSYAHLLSTTVKEQTAQAVKFHKAPSVLTEQSLWQDQFDQSVYGAVYGVELANNKGGHHALLLTHKELSKINMSYDEPLNQPASLFGLSYEYSMLKGKYNLWTRGALEYTKSSGVIFGLNLGSKFMMKQRFNGVQLGFEPNYTATSLTNSVYKGELSVYNEGYHGKSHFMSSISVLGRYYTNKTNSAVSDVKLHYVFRRDKVLKVLPFAEGMYAYGSADQAVGYPFWMLKQFYIAGGGLAAQYGANGEKLFMRVDAAGFHASLADVLVRFTGKVEWKVNKLGFLTANFEYYINQLYQANQVRVGFKYHL